MEAAAPTLSPRQELFCRYAAFGHSLAEAARRAGYSPTSARQRGSELYARPQIQDRVAVLAAHEARLEDASHDSYMRELREIRGYCKHYQQYGTALRALTVEIRLSGVKSRRAERRADDEEKEADLRTRLEAELRASIEAEMEERIARIEAEAYRRARAELAAELAGDRQAEPEPSGTNHDVCAKPDVTAPVLARAPVPAGLRAEPGLSGTFRDISAEPDHIDRLIADINGEPPRRAGRTGPAVIGHDVPGRFHEPRRGKRTGT